MLKELIYLWTRDAGFPVNEETEEYVLDHLKKLMLSPIRTQYSDKERSAMANQIIVALLGV